VVDIPGKFEWPGGFQTLVRIGRRVYLDVDAFDVWLTSQQERAA